MKLPQHIGEKIDDRLPQFISDVVWEVTDGSTKIEPKRFLTYQEEPVGSYEAVKYFIAQILEEEKGKLVREIKKMYLPETKETGGLPEDDEIAQSINDILRDIINLIKEDRTN